MTEKEKTITKEQEIIKRDTDNMLPKSLIKDLLMDNQSLSDSFQINSEDEDSFEKFTNDFPQNFKIEKQTSKKSDTLKTRAFSNFSQGNTNTFKTENNDFESEGFFNEVEKISYKSSNKFKGKNTLEKMKCKSFNNIDNDFNHNFENKNNNNNILQRAKDINSIIDQNNNSVNNNFALNKKNNFNNNNTNSNQQFSNNMQNNNNFNNNIQNFNNYPINQNPNDISFNNNNNFPNNQNPNSQNFYNRNNFLKGKIDNNNNFNSMNNRNNYMNMNNNNFPQSFSSNCGGNFNNQNDQYINPLCKILFF